MTSEDMRYRALVLRSLLMIVSMVTGRKDAQPDDLASDLRAEANSYTRRAKDLFEQGR